MKRKETRKKKLGPPRSMNLYDPGCPVYKGLVLYEIHGGGGGGGFELFFW